MLERAENCCATYNAISETYFELTSLSLSKSRYPEKSWESREADLSSTKKYSRESSIKMIKLLKQNSLESEVLKKTLFSRTAIFTIYKVLFSVATISFSF